jgi:hypothetical protein
MGLLQDRLIVEEGGARLRGNADITIDEILRRLEGGDLPVATEVSMLDLLAVLAFTGLGDAQSLGPPLIQQSPPRPRLEQAVSEPALARLIPSASRALRLALASGLLQVLDFWEASHEAAQTADNLGEERFSAYWHGIGHRREPDAGNAAYWFRHVGRHALFGPLAQAAQPILQDHGDERWSSKLLGPGGWNAMAMIDLCTQTRPETREEAVARRLQRLEMELLLGATVEAVCDTE